MKHMSHGLPNTKSVADFIGYIRDRLERSATAWREIAEAFAQAKEMFGGESDSFRNLCKETSFSKSTAHKLAAIALSERLAKYQEKLSAVHSWSTFYAITSLTEEKFKVLCERYKLDDPRALAPFLTESMVEAIRKEKTEKSSLKVYATIYVDELAMKAGLFDSGHAARLEESLDDLQKTLPYVKITKSGIEGRVESHYFDRIQRKKVELARQAFANELQAIDKRLESKKMPHESKKQCFNRSMCMSREELWDMFKSNPKDAFEYLGGDGYDEKDLYERAEQIVNAQDVKLQAKVRARAEPYKYANTVAKTEFSEVCKAADENAGLSEADRLTLTKIVKAA
jgi:hypothetical protein